MDFLSISTAIGLAFSPVSVSFFFYFKLHKNPSAIELAQLEILIEKVSLSYIKDVYIYGRPHNSCTAAAPDRSLGSCFHPPPIPSILGQNKRFSQPWTPATWNGDLAWGGG